MNDAKWYLSINFFFLFFLNFKSSGATIWIKRERETKVFLRRNFFCASRWKATANKLHINYLIIFNKCSRDAHFTCRKAATKVGLVLINYFWEHLSARFWSLNKKTYLKQIACQEDECSGGSVTATVILWQVSIPPTHAQACMRTHKHSGGRLLKTCDEVSHATFASNPLLY